MAKAKGSRPEDVTVVMLDRPRHEKLADEVRETGARIKFIVDGDVAGAIMAARPDTGIDMLLGIGGTPEGIIAACAMKCVGGVIQGRLWPKDDEERQRAVDAGHDLDPDHVLSTDDLVTGRRLLLRRQRHHRRRADAGRALPRPRGDVAVAGDALAQRHRAADLLRAPLREAPGPLTARSALGPARSGSRRRPGSDDTATVSATCPTASGLQPMRLTGRYGRSRLRHPGDPTAAA